MLKSWYEFLVLHFAQLIPDLIVYLRSSPESAFERMNSRMRGEESGVSLDYLTEIHDFFEGWLASTPGICKLGPDHIGRTCPVVVLNADLDAQRVLSQFDEKILPLF